MSSIAARRAVRAHRPYSVSAVEALEARQLLSVTWHTVGTASAASNNTITLDHAYQGDTDPYVNLQVQPDGSTFPQGVYAVQDKGVYGANAELDAAAKYSITYHYDVWTWDSYSDPADDPYYGGYYDAFSVSLAPQAYTSPAAQPDGYLGAKEIDGAANVWGGLHNSEPVVAPDWGLQHLVGDGTLNYTNADPSNPMFLNVVLDTDSQDQDPDGMLPSWGTVQITGITETPSVRVTASQSDHTLTLTRNGDTTNSLNAYYQIGGTATPDGDYTLSGDSEPNPDDPSIREVTFAAGSATAVVDLTATGSVPAGSTTITATVIANPDDPSDSPSYTPTGSAGSLLN